MKSVPLNLNHSCDCDYHDLLVDTIAQRDALISVVKEAMRWWESQVGSDISLIPATPSFYKTAKAAINLCSEGENIK